MYNDGVAHAAGSELEILWTGGGGVWRGIERREGESGHLERVDGWEGGVGAEAKGRV